jgi:hydroxyacylglutathione hydrolase
MKRILFILTIIIIVVTGCSQGAMTGSQPDVYTIFGSGADANSYVVANKGEAAGIDPIDAQKMLNIVKDNSLTLKYIILTHGHFDHIAGIDEITKKHPGIKVMMHPADSDKLPDPDKNLSVMFGTKVAVNSKTSALKVGDQVKIGDMNIEVIETPGHTVGSVCLKVGKLLFSGDTLFKGAVGRTDFPGSTPQDLQTSINKLKQLSGPTEVNPGHGEVTTIEAEK